MAAASTPIASAAWAFWEWRSASSDWAAASTIESAPGQGTTLTAELPGRCRQVNTGMRTIRVLLADDHNLIRAGLRLVVAQQPEFTVVGEAENGRQAVALAE